MMCDLCWCVLRLRPTINQTSDIRNCCRKLDILSSTWEYEAPCNSSVEDSTCVDTIIKKNHQRYDFNEQLVYHSNVIYNADELDKIHCVTEIATVYCKPSIVECSVEIQIFPIHQHYPFRHLWEFRENIANRSTCGYGYSWNPLLELLQLKVPLNVHILSRRISINEYFPLKTKFKRCPLLKPI